MKRIRERKVQLNEELENLGMYHFYYAISVSVRLCCAAHRTDTVHRNRADGPHNRRYKSKAHGTETHGTETHGTEADGTKADGTKADGTKADGTTTHRAATHRTGAFPAIHFRRYSRTGHHVF